jgi:Mg2+/citrate symporter
MEIDTERFHNSLISKLDELEDRIVELERPKYTFNNLMAIAGLLITVAGGVFTNIYITVSRIDALTIKYENMSNQVTELKQEIREIKDRR